MRIIFLGPPGSGKGTQADFICESFDIPRISTGDMLRTASQEKTPSGKHIKQLLDAGELISDEVVIKLLRRRLAQSDCKTGYLLDGFPRTIVQAETLRSCGVVIDCIVEIVLDHEAVIKRMTGRRFHLASGRSYHVLYNPPKESGLDDVTGEALIQRDDDREETVRHRLDVYQKQTQPVVNYYKHWMAEDPSTAPRFETVNGQGGVDEVRGRIQAVLLSS